MFARGGLALVARGRVRAGRARSTSPPRSPACAAASSSRCAGATSTSPATHPGTASYAGGHLTTPKSGKVRSVPMAPDVARASPSSATATFHRRRRPRLRRRGRRLPRRRALCGRYRRALVRADLRALRFHDLRHTFGTMIAKADVRRVQEWMGHADIQTTMKYLHYAPRAEDAEFVAEAFAIDAPAAGAVASLQSSPGVCRVLRSFRLSAAGSRIAHRQGESPKRQFGALRLRSTLCVCFHAERPVTPLVRLLVSPPRTSRLPARPRWIRD